MTVVFVARRLPPEQLARIQAVDPRIELRYDPALAMWPTGRLSLLYPPGTAREPDPSETAPRPFGEEDERRWLSLMADAEIMFDADPGFLDVLPEKAPALRWIQGIAAGAGEMLSSGPLRRSSIGIAAARGIHDDALADFTLMAILAHGKRLATLREHQARRSWVEIPGAPLTGSRLCVVGYGSIGRAIAVRARAFGMRISAVRRTAGAAPEADDTYVTADLPRALADADHVAITLPATDETHHLFDEKLLAAMKPGAYLVNVGRRQRRRRDRARRRAALRPAGGGRPRCLRDRTPAAGKPVVGSGEPDRQPALHVTDARSLPGAARRPLLYESAAPPGRTAPAQPRGQEGQLRPARPPGHPGTPVRPRRDRPGRRGHRALRRPGPGPGRQPLRAAALTPGTSRRPRRTPPRRRATDSAPLPAARPDRRSGTRTAATQRGEVDRPGHHEDRAPNAARARASGVRIEGPLGAEGGRDRRVALSGLGRVVSPGRRVPSAVGEGCDGLPVAFRGPACSDGLEGRVCRREPGLVLAEPGGLAPGLPADRDAHGPGARRDEHEPADALGVAGGVLHRDVRAGTVREQVQPVEAEVLPQSLDVVDEAVAPAGGEVVRYGGPPGAPDVRHDQLPVC